MSIHSNIEKRNVFSDIDTLEPETPIPDMAIPFSSILIQEEFLLGSLSESQHFITGSLAGGATETDIKGIDTASEDMMGAAFMGYDSVSEDFYIASKAAFPLGIGRAVILRFRIKVDNINWHICQLGFSDNLDNGNDEGARFRLSSAKFKPFTAGETSSDQGGDIEPSIVQDQIFNLRIEVNSDCSEIKYYVDDVIIETVTAPGSLPKYRIGAGNFMRVFIFIRSENSNPLGSHVLRVDYINLEIQ